MNLYHVYWADDEGNNSVEHIATTHADIMEKAIEYMRNPHTIHVYISKDAFPSNNPILTYNRG